MKPAEPSAAALPERARWGAALAACAAALLAFALWAPVRSRAGWDDSYYLLQGSSLVEDGDLDLRNDVLASAFGLPDRRELLAATTPSGSLDDQFSLGPALVWLPAYAAGAPLARRAPGTVAPRWGLAERDALHLLSLLLLAGVLFFLLRLHALAAPPDASALLPAAALFLGTPLLVYATSDYTMSHLPSAAATSLLVAAALALERAPRAAGALAAGVALGLVVLVRWQDVVFGVLLAVPLLAVRERRRAAALAAWAAAGFLAVASLQLHAWRLERGAWLVVPQGQGFFHAAHPELWRFLVSGRSGLLSWSPVFGLAIAGLLLPWRCRLSRRWAAAALLVLAAEIYANSAVWDWWGGHSCGARRMVSCVPLLPLGLANLRQLLSRRPARAAVAVALALCCGWGVFAAAVYRSGVQDLSLVVRGAPAEPGNRAIARVEGVKDPAAARAHLAHLALPPPADYWTEPGAEPSRGGTLLTWLLLAAAAGAAATALSRAAPRRLLAALAGGVLAVALGAHLRLALGPHPVAAERAAWRRLAEQWHLPPRRFDRAALAPPPAAGHGPASPADAYRYLGLFLEWRGGDPGRARELLRGLVARGYPAAREAQSALAGIEARQAGGRLVRWLPGLFFQPISWRPALAVPLPPAAGAARAWDLAFDLTLVELAKGVLYPVLHLAGSGGEPLADLAIGDRGLRLSTSAESVEETVGLAGARRYELRVRYSASPREIAVTLAGAGAARLRLTAAALAAPPAELTLGRPRSRPLRGPLLSGASFADLSVVADCRAGAPDAR